MSPPSRSSDQLRGLAGRRVVIAGASGLIGTEVRRTLLAGGCDVRQLVRREARARDEISWHPERGELTPGALQGADIVCNLSGENIGAGRWTARRRAEIARSRVDATRTLVNAMLAEAARPSVFISASAVGIYGDCGDAIVSEDTPAGTGFLAEVCRSWEGEAFRAAAGGVRTCCLRFGLVLAPNGGALGKLLPLFRLGLGGPVGSGRQWMSWISLPDVGGIVEHLIAAPTLEGAFNASAPAPVTNVEFSDAVGRALHRPSFLRVPGWVLRAVFGEMADGTLLASTRAVPERLRASGYRFQHATIAEALAAAVADR